MIFKQPEPKSFLDSREQHVCPMMVLQVWSATDKHFTLDPKDDFCWSCGNVSHTTEKEHTKQYTNNEITLVTAIQEITRL